MIINKEIFAQLTRQEILNLDEIFSLLLTYSKDPQGAFMAIHQRGLQGTLNQFRSLASEANYE